MVYNRERECVLHMTYIHGLNYMHTIWITLISCFYSYKFQSMVKKRETLFGLKKKWLCVLDILSAIQTIATYRINKVCNLLCWKKTVDSNTIQITLSILNKIWLYHINMLRDQIKRHSQKRNIKLVYKNPCLPIILLCIFTIWFKKYWLVNISFFHTYNCKHSGHDSRSKNTNFFHTSIFAYLADDSTAEYPKAVIAVKRRAFS